MKIGYLLIVLLIIHPSMCNTDVRCHDDDCKYCRDGWYGPSCSFSCPTNCDSGCSRTHGHCDHQCKPNYTGRFCELLCPPNCRNGCNQTTAACHEGCRPTFHGVYCNISCSENCHICNRQERKCIQWKTTVAPKDNDDGMKNGRASIQPNGIWILVCAAVVLRGLP